MMRKAAAKALWLAQGGAVFCVVRRSRAGNAAQAFGATVYVMGLAVLL
jgi:hypothetical protein